MTSVCVFVCVCMFPTQCVYPLELSVRDKQLILTTTAGSVRADRRRFKDLTAALFSQLLPLHEHIWQQKQTPRQS